MKVFDIDAVGIKEHRMIHEEPLKYIENDGVLMITSSALKNDVGAAVGGVGVFLEKHAKSAFLSA